MGDSRTTSFFRHARDPLAVAHCSADISADDWSPWGAQLARVFNVLERAQANDDPLAGARLFADAWEVISGLAQDASSVQIVEPARQTIHKEGEPFLISCVDQVHTSFFTRLLQAVAGPDQLAISHQASQALSGFTPLADRLAEFPRWQAYYLERLEYWVALGNPHVRADRFAGFWEGVNHFSRRDRAFGDIGDAIAQLAAAGDKFLIGCVDQVHRQRFHEMMASHKRLVQQTISTGAQAELERFRRLANTLDHFQLWKEHLLNRLDYWRLQLLLSEGKVS